MPTGAITGYMDVAQIALYAFWIFFAGLIYYLRREDKREGYPLVSERSKRTGGRITVQGFPFVPTPKVFRLPHGGTVQAPRGETGEESFAAAPATRFLGAPLVPTGNPLLDGVGPAAYAQRADEPERTVDNWPLISPMRVMGDEVYVEPNDPDPRGFDVVGADWRVGGTVVELWVDRAEPQVRYLEVEVAGGKHVMVPITMAVIHGKRRLVEVSSVLASQLAMAPGTKNPDEITKLEEDRITAFYAGGQLYAYDESASIVPQPARPEPQPARTEPPPSSAGSEPPPPSPGPSTEPLP